MPDPEPIHMAEPAWLAAQADQVVAKMKDAGAFKFDAEVIMATLTEPESLEAAPKWERTCDNCGLYCPDFMIFYTGQVMRLVGTARVVITFGACTTCKNAP